MFEYVLILLFLFMAAALAYLLYERYQSQTRTAESGLYVEALRDLVDGKHESAFTKLRQVVTADSGNIDAYLRLGQILREHHKADRALQVHKDLTLRGGLTREQKVATLRQLAMDYLALNDLTTARQALEELISLDSRNHWAHTRLLRLLEKEKNWREAYDVAVEVLKLESNKSKKPLAYYKYREGDHLFKTREYHKARVILKEAIGLDPQHVQAYLVIGDSYYAEKRLEDAVNFWSKLIAAVPQQGHLAIERLEKTLFDLGRFGDIVEKCQSILKHDPRNLEARRTLALFYQKKGELDQAVEIMENIVEDYPDDSSTLVSLIRFYLEKGDNRKLNELLQTLERKRDEVLRGPAAKPADSVPSGA